MNKNLNLGKAYDSPNVKVVAIKPHQCLATSYTQTPGGVINGFDDVEEG